VSVTIKENVNVEGNERFFFADSGNSNRPARLPIGECVSLAVTGLCLGVAG
jgi:hypothetical protein